MAQIFTINEAQTLISDLIHETWEAEKPASSPAFERYMNVGSMGPEDINYRMAGFSPFEEHFEGTDLEADQLEFGEKQTIRPRNWGKMFEVSEYVIQDLADTGTDDGINRARLGSLSDFTKRTKRSAIWTVEKDCTDILLNGTSSTGRFASRTGGSLFSASHSTMKNPPVTQSNTSTGASLSQTQLETAIKALDVQLDDRGDYMADDGGYTVVVSPHYRWRVKEILKTTGKVDSEQNNINTLKDEDIKVVVNKYLGSSYAGFFVLKNGVHSLNWKWRMKPQVKEEGNFTAVTKMYRSIFRGASYVKDWRGTYGYMP